MIPWGSGLPGLWHLGIGKTDSFSENVGNEGSADALTVTSNVRLHRQSLCHDTGKRVPEGGHVKAPNCIVT